MASAPVTSTSLTPDEFAATVVAVTSAFGDPTRRDIYLFVRDADHGVTAGEAAEHFDLHPNVARHHLDKLAAGGYLDVDVARGPGAGAGRPSKRYSASDKGTGLNLPLQRDHLLVALLGRALELLPPAEAERMAEEVGADYGRELAARMSPGEGQVSFRTALHAVAEALTAHGFAAHTEARNGALAIISEQCPFGDATQHPLVCAIDRGMVKGMLAGLYGDSIPATLSSRARGDGSCVTGV